MLKSSSSTNIHDRISKINLEWANLRLGNAINRVYNIKEDRRTRIIEKCLELEILLSSSGN